MSGRERISAARLVARLRKRLSEDSEPRIWDRQADLALRAVADGDKSAEFDLAFWIGFAEGANTFRRGAWLNEVAGRKAKARGVTGGRANAHKAEQRWRASATVRLVELARRNPGFGKRLLTIALLDDPEFEFDGEEPSEGSIGRLIDKMRGDGRLPPRSTDSQEKG